MPYLERQNAGIMAAALNLREDLRSADFAGAIKSGTSPCFPPWKPWDQEASLKFWSPPRLPPGQDGQPPGNDLWGRGGGFCRRRSKRHRRIQGVLFPDRGFRGPRARVQKLVRSPVGRPLDPGCGFGELIPKAVEGLRNKATSKTPTFQRSSQCQYDAERKSLAKALKIDPAKIQEPLHGTVGETGTAHALLMFARALKRRSRGPDSPGEFRQRLRRPAF